MPEIYLQKISRKITVGDDFWDPKSMKIVRPKLQKAQKDAKQCDFGETRFLTVFWMAQQLLLGSKWGPNHSGAKARERQEIEKNDARLLRRCCLVLGDASGRVFRRCSDRFGMFFNCFLDHCSSAFRSFSLALPRHKICNQSQNPSAATSF